MLDTLRRGANTWAAKALLAVLILSFGLWGVSDFFLSGASTDAVAQVGETEVDTDTFSRIYTSQLAGLSQQLSTSITPEMAVQFGFPQSILAALVSDAALNEKMRRMGVGISDDTVAQSIANDPNVQIAGQFDAAYFRQLLAQNGLNEDTYVADWRAYLLREQIRQGLFGDAEPPRALVEAMVQYQNEVRTVDYVRLDPALVQPIETPTDEEVQAYYDAHTANFRTPEYRTVTVLDLSPDSRVDLDAVTDEEVRAAYDRAIDSFSTPERRRVLQVLFPSLEEAQAAYDRATAGGSFADVLTARGVTEAEADLGLVTAAQIADPAISAAAFALEPNTVSMPIEGRFGAAIVEVTEVQPGMTRSFEEVAPEIRRQLALADAREGISSLYEEILDAEAGGQPLADIAMQFNLPATTVTVSSAGLDPSGQPTALPDAQGLLTGVFQAEIGMENDPVATAAGSYVWYEVTDITAAQDRTIEEARADVVAAWQAEQAAERLTARAQQVRAAVAAGVPFDTAAASLGLELMTSGPITRGASIPELGEAAVRGAFGGPEGYTVALSGPDDSQIVLRVASITVPEFSQDDQTTATLVSTLETNYQSGLVQRYAGVLQSQIGTTVNEAAFATAIGLPAQ